MLHDLDLSHALKKAAGAAISVARTPDQVAQLLAHVAWDELAR